MSVKSPCKNCADRTMGCHGVCKDYLEYKRVAKEEADWNRQHKPPSIYAKSFTGTTPPPGTRRRPRRTDKII